MSGWPTSSGTCSSVSADCSSSPIWAIATLFGRTVPGYALSPREDGKRTLPRSVIWSIALAIAAVYAYKERGDLLEGVGENSWLQSLTN